MQRIIVSDTSCLILLDKLKRLDLLQELFGNVIITQIVADEFGKDIPVFIQIQNPEHINYQKILESTIDVGEASVMALALETKNCLLIIDDNKGRKQAKRLGIAFTGTLGLLIIGKQKGYIKSITEILNKIQKTDFRLSESIINDAKRMCNE